MFITSLICTVTFLSRPFLVENFSGRSKQVPLHIDIGHSRIGLRSNPIAIACLRALTTLGLRVVLQRVPRGETQLAG